MVETIRSFGNGLYFRLRRLKKAFRNWKKFGVVMFGSLFLASSILPLQQTLAAADDITSVLISGPSFVDEGKSVQFTAQAYNGLGPINSGVAYNWFTTDYSAGVITGSGMFTAKKAGYYPDLVRVTAMYNGKPAGNTATVTIKAVNGGTTGDNTNKVLTSILISPPFTTVASGAQKPFTAQAYDQNNATIDGVVYNWSVTNGAVGSINSNGVLTGGNVGVYNDAVKVSVTYNGVTKTNTADVTVTAASGGNNNGGDTSQRILTSVLISPPFTTLDPAQHKDFVAEAYDQYNNRFASNSGITFGWSVSNATAGSIAAGRWDADGVQRANFTANQSGYYPGVVHVSATYGGVTKTNLSDVTVRSITPPVDVCAGRSISVSATGNPSNQLTLVNGQATQAIRADITATGGNSLNGDYFIHFTTSPEASSSIQSTNENAQFTATAPGTYTVRVTAKDENGQCADLSATLILTVLAQPQGSILHHIKIVPHFWSMQAGDYRDYTVHAYLDQAETQEVTNQTTFVWHFNPSLLNSPIGTLTTYTGKDTRFISFPNAVTTTTTFYGFLIAEGTYNGVTKSDSADIQLTPFNIQQEFLNSVTATANPTQVCFNNASTLSAQAKSNSGANIAANYTWVKLTGSGNLNTTQGQTVTYTSSNAVETAIFQVTATSLDGTRTANSTVSVTTTNCGNPNVLSLTIEPPVQTVGFNQFATYTAHLRDNMGNNYDGTTNFVFSMPNGGGTIWSQSGNVVVIRSGSQAGNFPVRVDAQGMSAFATLIVQGNTQFQGLNGTIFGVIEDGSTPSPCDVIVYTVTIRNPNPTAVNNVQVTMPIPAHTEFVSATSANAAPTFGGTQVLWNIGTMQGNETRTMMVRVRILCSLDRSASIVANATVTSNEVAPFTITSNRIDVVIGGRPVDRGKGPLTPTGINAGTVAGIFGLSTLFAVLAYMWMNRRKVYQIQ